MPNTLETWAVRIMLDWHVETGLFSIYLPGMFLQSRLKAHRLGKIGSREILHAYEQTISIQYFQRL